MRPTGQLDRSLAKITLGLDQHRNFRARRLSDTYTGIRTQPYFLPVTGHAAPTPALTDKDVMWEAPFLYAAEQSKLDYPTPRFSCDFEFTTPPVDGAALPIHIDLRAYVIGWTYSPELWIVGAKVRIAAHAPTATALIPYDAIAHMAFQGYCTFSEGAGDVVPTPPD